MLLGAGLLTDLFGLEPDAKEAAMLQMHIVPLSYMALGCSMAVDGSLNALGRPMSAIPDPHHRRGILGENWARVAGEVWR